MSNKEVEFLPRPSTRAKPQSRPAEAWVSGAPVAGRLVKLTLEVPEDQHIAFKTRCVREKVSMQDKVKAMIEAYLATGE